MDTFCAEKELKAKRICRFCLTQEASLLKNIYARDERIKSTAPLPLQVMAIASIEVHISDGMPAFICNDCRIHFEYSYRFKQMCKRADTLLRQYPFVKKFPEPLPKPKLPIIPTYKDSKAIYSMPPQTPITGTEIIIHTPVESTSDTSNTSSAHENVSFNILPTPIVVPAVVNNVKSTPEVFKGPKRLHNANPSQTPEPPIPKRIKIEKPDKTSAEAATALLLDKVDNNDEMSLDDVKLFIQAAENDDILVFDNDDENSSLCPDSELASKPKLLNKASKRILNKEADLDYEPRISAPQVKRNEAGNVEVVTEILDPNEPYETEPDPLKSAIPIETNVFPCNLCIRTFPLKQLLDIHMEKHMRDRPHPCTECGKSFFTKYDLQKHAIIHTGEKPFKCSVCDKGFNRAALLHLHEKTHPDVAKFICIYCEKPFISKDELHKHMQRHLKHRPFLCKICNKSFAFKQGLERHEIVHSKEHAFRCEYCEMSFTTPGKLARHVTAHAGKRAYPCKYCGKAFILSHHLTRHLRSHKEFMSDFICGCCKIIHKTREEFIAHCATHAYKTHICPLCKENLETNEHVERHMQEHEKEGFACQYCDLMFTENSKLVAHLDAEHVDDQKNIIFATDKQDTQVANSKRKIVKRNNQSIEQYEEHLLDDVLIDDDTINESDDSEKRSMVTETIKIEPLTAEDEREHAELQRQEQIKATTVLKQKQIKQSPATTPQNSSRKSINNTKQSTLNIAAIRRAVEGGIQVNKTESVPATTSTRPSPNNKVANTEVKTNVKTLPVRRPQASPPKVQRIIQQQKLFKKSPTTENSNSTENSPQTTEPRRMLRIVKKTNNSTDNQTTASNFNGRSPGESPAVRTLRSEKPTNATNATTPAGKMKRVSLTKQELSDLVKKGHKVIKVPRDSSK